MYNDGDLIAGRFLVRKTITTGGMGTVFICRDDLLKRNVALKTFSGDFHTRDGDSRAQLRIRDLFMKEALNWIRLGEHDHVVTAHMTQIVAGRPYIIAEAIIDDNYESLDLRRFLSQHKQLDPKAITGICLQIALGMQYAASKLPELVHCDLKPENVLITQDGVCKVSDFGVARASFLASSAGTPPYMSPEQWRGDLLDVKSDIYSLGCVAYELLTGFPPFMKVLRDMPDLRRHHETVKPQIPGYATQFLGEFIATCLEKSPANRYANWTTVVDKLYENLQTMTGHRAPSTQTPKTADFLRQMELIMSMTQLGRFHDALPLCEELTASDPENLEFWALQAQILSALGERAEALRILDTIVLKKAPDNAAALHGKAMVLMMGIEEEEEQSAAKVQLEEALRFIDHALQLQPDSAHYWATKASILHLAFYLLSKGGVFSANEARQILYCLDEAMRLEPAILDIRNELVTARIRSLRAIIEPEQLLVEINRTLERAPGLVEVWAEKAQLLIEMQRLDEAQETLIQAKKIEPSNHLIAIVQDQLNWLKRKADEEGKSLAEKLMPTMSDDHSAHLWQLMNEDERSLEYWMGRAEELRNLERYEEALKACDRALEFDEWFYAAWAVKGTIHGLMGQTQEAIVSLKRSVDLEPKDADVWYYYGLALLDGQQYKEALHALVSSSKLGNQDAGGIIDQLHALGKMG